MSSNEYDTLREANIARHKEWCQEVKLSLSYRGNELAGEVGEACNILKKLDRELLGLVGSKSNLNALAEELADVLICVDLIAMDLNIDMDSAVRSKFNKTSLERGLKVLMSKSTCE